MSNELLQEEVGSQQGKLYNDDQVNSIVRDKLNRADERLQQTRREYEDKLARAQQAPAIDENALLEKAAALAEQRLQTSWQNAYEAQESERQNAEHQTHINQYLEHVKDFVRDDENDPSGVFAQEGVKHYGALLVTAGKFNMENTREILAELSKKPDKLVSIARAASERNESAVKAAFKQIDSSIRKNKEALENKPNIYSPVSHNKPSGVGSSSGSKYDWKNGVDWKRLS